VSVFSPKNETRQIIHIGGRTLKKPNDLE
jgi:hypothetical protein